MEMQFYLLFSQLAVNLKTKISSQGIKYEKKFWLPSDNYFDKSLAILVIVFITSFLWEFIKIKMLNKHIFFLTHLTQYGL